jgi:hypothetical protein
MKKIIKTKIGYLKPTWILIILLCIIICALLAIKLGLFQKKENMLISGNNVNLNTPSLFIDSNGLQVRENNIDTVFTYDGFFRGHYFKNEYSERNNVLMSITSNLNPNDGIINGFIVIKFEGNPVIPVAYVFLDEDWKNNVEETTIFWGKRYENKKEFSFKEVSKGVYMDKIEDDPDRYSNNYTFRYGGVVVGNSLTDKNATLIRIV